MKKMISWMDAKFYPTYSRNWDDQLFRLSILENLKSNHAILDLGAGAGIVEAMDFRGKAHYICGIDPDQRVKTNPYLHNGQVGLAESIPFADAAFDLVFADNVVEHLTHPEQVFSEVHRTLKSGGLFYFKTPNKNHYMPLIARATPLWFHKLINKLRGRATADTFPTVYKANSAKQIAYYAQLTGFEIKFIHFIEGRPEYLRFSIPSYLLGLLYERLVNSSKIWANFRILTIACLQKKEEINEASSY